LIGWRRETLSRAVSISRIIGSNAASTSCRQLARKHQCHSRAIRTRILRRHDERKHRSMCDLLMVKQLLIGRLVLEVGAVLLDFRNCFDRFGSWVASKQNFPVQGLKRQQDQLFIGKVLLCAPVLRPANLHPRQSAAVMTFSRNYVNSVEYKLHNLCAWIWFNDGPECLIFLHLLLPFQLEVSEGSIFLNERELEKFVLWIFCRSCFLFQHKAIAAYN
jgi:hypothetical protein